MSINNNNNIDAKSATESQASTIVPPTFQELSRQMGRVDARVINFDMSVRKMYFDISILDRHYRFYGHHRGEEIYRCIRASLKKTIFRSLDFVVLNGPLVVPNTSESLVAIPLVDECLRVSFDHEGSNTSALSWSVLFERACMQADMDVQSNDATDSTETAAGAAFLVMLKLVGKQLDGLKVPNVRYWLNTLNNIGMAYRSFKRCVTIMDYYDEIQKFYYIFLGRSAFLDSSDFLEGVLKDLFKEDTVQADSTEILHNLRQAFDMVTGVGENPTIKKLQSLFSYALVQGYLKQFGMELSDDDYSKMEQRQLLGAYSSRKGFFFAVLDTTLHVAERLNAWYITGDFDNFIHSEKMYVDWMKEADRLLGLAAFTSNLTALGNDSFKFKADLEDALTKGRAYVKFTSKSGGVDCVALRKKLCALELLNNTEMTKRAAQVERKAPFGVLISGHSSIAKSAFTKVVYNAYASLFGLDRSDAGCYSRNSFDEFWSGFNSSQWCIRMDDIAFQNPAKTTQIDNSIIEMLNVINNVPFVPNQASLDAKGTTPVLAKLVIATTNTEHLNTSEYFACPLAANRRLPYVVHLAPKKEYLHENQVFIDPSKLVCEEGKFPNFWVITVREIVPVIGLDKKERAMFKDVAVFEDIDEFIQHFLKAARVHERNQDRAIAKNTDMATIEICQNCLKPLPHIECMEIQAGELTLREKFFVYVLMWLFSCRWFVETLVLRFTRNRFTRTPVYTMINFLPPVDSVRMYARLAELRQNERMKQFIAGLTIVSGAFALFYATQKRKPVVEKIPVVELKSEPIADLEHDVDLGIQSGDRLVETQLEKEIKNDVWYKADVTISTFDMPTASLSLAKATNSEIRNILDKNCVAVSVRAGGRINTLRGVFVVGQKLLLPSHAFKHMVDECEVNVINSDITNSHNSNIKFTLTKSQLVMMQGMDLCMIEVAGAPPRKSILKFFQREEVIPTSGFSLMRQTDGSLNIIPFFNMRKDYGVHIEKLDIRVDIFMAYSSQETEAGMCGSLCIGTTPRGPIILGTHLLGSGNHVGFLSVKADHVEAMMKHKIFHRADVEGGGEPEMRCSKRNYAIQSLHHRSLIRYLPTVNANVYGTLDSFAGKQGSKVCATPLQNKIIEKYGMEVKHGAPFLGGYHGVKQNVAPMVIRTNNYNKLFLRDCVLGYTNDIISRLPQRSKDELIHLSVYAAINGLPGVRFIDGINRNTSMGFPFNTTKKEFLEPSVMEGYPDGVIFKQEVMERIFEIEKIYSQGRRVYPVFAGHNKDEALPLEKVLAKKCRLFTGSPVAWSIVVRRNLLTFVRCVQKNQLIFEAGPGLVCQSNEWSLVRDHLCQFGEDQIVAGDYGKFDKRMLSDFILAAFDVIINVLRDAGWTEKELLVVQCIAYDVAFPVCSINGDLIEFFGTNPSGHPLTVIINSLVNSLYMRYCYRAMNPEQKVSDFQKHVALFTYGDDNAMGVSKSQGWFNHTSIQACLARIGVEYTMADKESESVPYINISETSFLKRKWRWDDRMKCYLCPLDEESIFKSLTVWVPSDTIDKYSQFVGVVESAVQEYFFYGERKFEEMRTFFMGLLSEEPFSLYVTKSTFPTYDQLEARFKAASVGMDVQGSPGGLLL